MGITDQNSGFLETEIMDGELSLTFPKALPRNTGSCSVTCKCNGEQRSELSAEKEDRYSKTNNLKTLEGIPRRFAQCSLSL